MAEEATFRNYLRAFFRHWFTAMSGPLSVPLVIAAYFVSNALLRLGLAATAIVCFGFSSYWIWRTERQRVVHLSEKLRPKLLCSFSKDNSGCVKITENRAEVNSDGGIIPVFVRTTWYRLEIIADGNSMIPECIARLMSITMDGKVILGGEIVRLPFAPAASQDAHAKNILPGHPEYLDFLIIGDDGIPQISTNYFWMPSTVNAKSILTNHGDYFIRIVISSTESTAIEVNVLFHWNGTSANSKIELIN